MNLVLHLPYHEALARERALLGETPHDPELKWMLWQTPPCIVVPRSHANYHNFEQAIAASEARGWPVFLRDTGGGAVVQGPDVINLSMRFSADATGHDRISLSPVVPALDSDACHARDHGSLPSGFRFDV
ncbi:lipoyl protein ligase domain-containing protein [Brucella pseudogrignonensis]|uniref:lipoyl protein ligase domain-containing protein n=1 Tax=Brucella pseudogrignonensis TaxID=419475 RepID=UPI003ECF5AA6